MKTLRLTKLRHFVTVAEHGTLCLAARTLGVSQPGLTRSIQRLEHEYGAPLFTRNSRGMELTRMGQLLLKRVRSILEEADFAIEDWKSMTGETSGCIRLGMSPNFAGYIVPAAIQAFAECYRDTRVDVQMGGAEELVSMVADTQAHAALALIQRSQLDLTAGREMDVLLQQLGIMRSTVFAPATHRLATGGEPTLEQMQRERWAVPHGLSLNCLFQAAFAARQLPPPVQAFNSSSIGLMVDTALRLNLLMIMPEHLLRKEIDSGAIVPLASDELTVEYVVTLITRRRNSSMKELNHFVDLLRRQVAEELASGELQDTMATPQATLVARRADRDRTRAHQFPR